jgi:hypothetical protein
MEEKMRGLIGGVIAITGVAGFYALSIGMFIGWAWWMWMAIHLGSFGMFVFGIFGPLAFLAAPLGLWSILFGIPKWLLYMVT